MFLIRMKYSHLWYVCSSYPWRSDPQTIRLRSLVLNYVFPKNRMHTGRNFRMDPRRNLCFAEFFQLMWQKEMMETVILIKYKSFNNKVCNGFNEYVTRMTFRALNFVMPRNSMEDVVLKNYFTSSQSLLIKKLSTKKTLYRIFEILASLLRCRV